MGIVTTIAPIALALIMLGLGASLTVKDFTRVCQNPKDFFIGLSCQLILLPIIAYLLIIILRTPIELARISSHYNPNRKHPVLNTIRAHKGTYYAAKTGTPVKVTGATSRMVVTGISRVINWRAITNPSPALLPLPQSRITESKF